MAPGGLTEGAAMSLPCQAVVVETLARHQVLGALLLCRQQGVMTLMTPRPQCPRPGLLQLPLWTTTTHLALTSHQQREQQRGWLGQRSVLVQAVAREGGSRRTKLPRPRNHPLSHQG